MVWVEIDDDDETIVPLLRFLAVGDELIVVDVNEPEITGGLKRGIGAPYKIYFSNNILQIPGGVPIPLLDLVLFRIEVLFLSFDGGIEAQFKGRSVDPVIG